MLLINTSHYIILISADESGVSFFLKNICPCFHVPQRLERGSIVRALAKTGDIKEK